MIHPLFRLIASQPHMVADHLAAYSELVSEEVVVIAGAWKRKAIFLGSAAVLMLLAVIWAGIALMLWGAMPPDSMHAPWLVWATPLVTALVAVALVFASKTSAATAAFASVKSQFAADAAMLREAGAA